MIILSLLLSLLRGFFKKRLDLWSWQEIVERVCGEGWRKDILRNSYLFHFVLFLMLVLTNHVVWRKCSNENFGTSSNRSAPQYQKFTILINIKSQAITHSNMTWYTQAAVWKILWSSSMQLLCIWTIWGDVWKSRDRKRTCQKRSRSEHNSKFLFLNLRCGQRCPLPFGMTSGTLRLQPTSIS